MSNRYSRHQSIINREADVHIDEDHWLKQFQKNLEKSAVQSRRVDQSLFDQINGIMNNKSKYTSVSAAVEDMMQRSGLIGYLKNINKVSTDENTPTKTADSKSVDKDSLISITLKRALIVLHTEGDDKWKKLGKLMGKLDIIQGKKHGALASIEEMKKSQVEDFKEVIIPDDRLLDYAAGYAEGAKLNAEEKDSDNFKNLKYLKTKSLNKDAGSKKKSKEHNQKKVKNPKIIIEVPSIADTLENIMDSNKHLPLPAILEKIKSIHMHDVSDARDWDDEDFLIYINSKKLEKQLNHVEDRNYSNLGRIDTSSPDTNDSNTDAFQALMPAKI